MSDTEFMISLVEAHPCIWDPSLPEYHDKEKKESAWLEVCEAIVLRWDELSDQEKLLRRIELKKKWYNCRDYYKKDMQRSGQLSLPERRKRRYVFAEHLRFLDKVIRGPEEPNETFDDDQKADDILIVEVGEEADDRKKIKIKSNNAESKPKSSQEIFNDFLNITHKRRYNDHTDDDEKYLLSFRSEMQKMTHAQKIDFKLGMMELVKSIFQGESDQNAPCSSSHQYAHSSTCKPDLSPEYLLDESPSD